MLPHLLLSSLLLCFPSYAIQLPFKVQIPFLSTPKPSVEVDLAARNRIAIIGAGAGGSSAAFWIARARERFGMDLAIDVYEQSSYIGGRSTIIYPYNDSSLPAFELGASIFIQNNKNLWRASEEFNLPRRAFRGEENFEMGIWDGQDLLPITGKGWWQTLKILWRYGLYSPKQTDSLVKNMVKRFLTLYSSTTPRWDDVSGLTSELGFLPMTSQTMFEYLSEQGVSPKFSYEVVEAATRVNYGQNVDKLHAIEGAISMAANGATGIAGGNFLMFEKFLEYANATVKLETKVKSVTQSNKVWSVETSSGTKTNYRAVILAAPYHSSGISLSPSSLTSSIPKQPYVNLHVTLLATTAPYANATYFGLGEKENTPRFMFTTGNGERQGGKRPEFNSMSYHHELKKGEEWGVKIFSEEEISDEFLERMFGDGKVGWVYRKVWEAYPYLPPTTTFPPVRLDKGLFYVNSFEPFISTMETETISSRNVVDLLLNEEYGKGICGNTLGGGAGHEKKTLKEEMERIEKEAKEGYVYGWDC